MCSGDFLVPRIPMLFHFDDGLLFQCVCPPIIYLYTYRLYHIVLCTLLRVSSSSVLQCVVVVDRLLLVHVSWYASLPLLPYHANVCFLVSSRHLHQHYGAFVCFCYMPPTAAASCPRLETPSSCSKLSGSAGTWLLCIPKFVEFAANVYSCVV